MTLPNSWTDNLPAVRGRIMTHADMAPFTWFRVGGPADVIFLPADEADLEAFLKALDPAVPVMTVGVGSNLLVRDGGVDGVVIRLGKGFADIRLMDHNRIYAGAAALDKQVAKVAAQNGIGDLEFYTGVPGTIGGAIVMNAGCYGSETKDVLVEAYALTRAGERVILSNKDMGYTYRHSVPENLIYTGALYQGTPDDPVAVMDRMDEITARRETTQPIREKTGGSTFKNPEGHSAWKLVDEAGWRGKLFGGAKFSELHSNFLINTGDATAADLEGLGDTVRAEVKDRLGVELNWEIKRVGRK
ncbi:UDP-N-acetylmuramate dehydrogenase [Asticcacaulis endophyticus]|uniref:UDP-N-acetylenolpyruvoylglucosamine reductase n=1 Tax=Asticcacaulis endophyticus TaxID=1395890 RepID=A0A918UQS2_9CAUL|nr:UDP-N-acetylmuramate dehydrogenase [Asticcacaulis endophyticus]GGZ28774.1 UDP-N-acetylenolpyruvoylglucosamine reductase [Asticcacaulis endophyticus]